MKNIFIAAAVALLLPAVTQAQSFVFGRNTNGLTGQSSAFLEKSGTLMALDLQPADAVFNENISIGLGVDSRGIDGVIDIGNDKLNILGGIAQGQSESITFSFNRPGVIEQLLFDGLKDESLEYFTLLLPDGSELSLFDFEVERRLNDQQFELSDLGVLNPTQAVGPSDDFLALAISFAAGEEFTLTYGEIDYDGSVLPGYFPADDNLRATGDTPNGARFQGVVVITTPEPSAVLLVGVACCVSCFSRLRSLNRRAGHNVGHSR